MANTAVEVLLREIEILDGGVRGISDQREHYQQEAVDKIKEIDVEITKLLQRAGIYQEHQDLRHRKVLLRQEMDKQLQRLNGQKDQILLIRNYLADRLKAYRAEEAGEKTSLKD